MSTKNSLSSRVEKFATKEEPFHFTDSGLDNIYLIGIKYFVDEEGNSVAEIPALKQLMSLIARDIVLSPLDLNGQEIRFLRKRIGKKATEFCTYLGMEPETLSRIENDRISITIPVQKLSRLVYCTFSEDPALVNCAKSIFQSIMEDMSRKQAKPKIVLQIDNHQEWRELQAA
jgi:transcriptional regulator with XRE-family HTH domain